MREMKDSGIEWVKTIPQSWNVRRGKTILSLQKRTPEDFGPDDVITCFRDGEVTLRRNRREDGFTFSDKEIGYQGIHKGDLVIHGMDGFAGAIGVSDSDGKASPVLVVCDSKENKRFLMYYLRMLASQNVFLALATGIRERSCDLRWNKIADLLFPIPQRSEQDKIVEYLDNKCALVDSIISKQKIIIDKLKEYKMSLISEVTAKGLRTNAVMRDSGIEWIGEVCNHFEVVRLKYLLEGTLIYGASESGIEYDETLPRYIRITDIDSDGKLKDTGKLSLTEEQAAGYILKDGDILFARSGGTVGKTFLYDEKYGRAAFAGYLIKATTLHSRLLPKYLYYYTLSSSYELWKDYIFNQATIQNIGADKYSDLLIPLPPISEQNDIVTYLDKKLRVIDDSLKKRELLIERCADYKKALIYEVITGKKEV